MIRHAKGVTECSGAFRILHQFSKDHIMLNKFKLALAGSVMAAAMLSSGAQAATATGTAKVEILVPVELSTVADLDFGLVASSASAGTVVLPTGSNTRACTNVTCVGTAANYRQPTRH
jgi:Mat/Ecp fimbriae major subunit